MIGGLAARGAAYRRGEAPTPTTPELSAGARRVAEQFRDELENRRAADDDVKTARARARARDSAAPADAPEPRAAVDGADVALVAAVAAAQPRYVSRPTPSMPGVYELSTEALAAAPNAGAVDALYAAWPEQCSADARRFMNAAARDAWLDIVFARNQARAERARGATSRPWNPARAAWLADGTAEADAAPDDALAPDAADGTDALAPDDAAEDECARVVVPDDAAPTLCRVCGEAFDVAWDATAGEWVLAAAVSVSVDDGTDAVVHRACRDAVCGRGGTLEAAALVPAGQTAPPPAVALAPDPATPLN